MTPALEARLVQVRLASGAVLFTYVATHLAEMAVGVVSLPALESAHRVAVAIWRSPPLWPVVPLALVTHVVLALYSLLRRRTARRMTAAEVAQAALAHLIPLFLLGHLVQTRVMRTLHGVDDTYAVVLGGPFPWFFHVGLLAVAWGHGLLGVRAFLRTRAWYETARPAVWAVLFGLPVLALAGVFRAYVELPPETEFARAAWRDAYDERVLRIHAWTLSVVLGGVALAWVARAAYGSVLRRRPRVEVRFPGKAIQVLPGTTILEASRMAGVEHVSVCGGRGRCTTCRVRVHEGLAMLPAASPLELRVLARIHAPENVRLACQVRPVAPVAVSPIVRAKARPQDGIGKPSEFEGREIDVVVLFADLRGFTKTAETMLPFDVAHFLGLYCQAMGEAIEKNGGYVDKFLGDGVMALFGMHGDPAAPRQALAAAGEMASRLEQLGSFFETELGGAPRMGIGIHRGPAIVAKMGFGDRMHLTAVGDTVNTASRLEALTKDLGCWLVVSETVLQDAGVSGVSIQEVQVRGRAEALRVGAIADRRSLPAPPGRSAGR